MRREIDRVQQRTWRYWYEDGVVEIAAGGIFLLLGLLFLVEGIAPAGSLPASFSAIGLPVVLIGGMWLAGRIVAAVKARLTYPRTGYVAYSQPARARRLATGIVAVVVGALVAGLLTRAPATLAWVPLLQGLIVGAALLYFGQRIGLTRFFVLALVSALAGVAASLAGLGESLGDAAYFGAMGVALLVSGGLTLRTYLSRTQPPAEG